MSTLASQAANVVLRRVRDPNAIAHSRTLTIARLSDCQRFINAALGLYLDTASLPINPYQSVYGITGVLPNATRVVAVREGTRDLAKMRDLSQLQALDQDWPRTIGSRFEAWTAVGRDLLVVYPCRAVSTSLTVVYAKLTTLMAGETDAFDIPDEYVDRVNTLAEAVLLLRQRDLQSAQAAIARVMEKTGPDMIPTRLHIAGATTETTMGEARKA